MAQIKFLQITPADNVAVALETLPAGTAIEVSGSEIVLKSEIARGHKFALGAISKDENIVKYGFPIGHATCDIAPGDHVHIHNIKTNLSGVEEYDYKPELPEIQTSADSVSFNGFERPDRPDGRFPEYGWWRSHVIEHHEPFELEHLGGQTKLE